MAYAARGAATAGSSPRCFAPSVAHRRNEVKGRFHAGEEMPDPTGFRKSDMTFLSGERLPRCWVDPYYKERKI